MLEHTLSEEEHSQIVQTIEMFEVITQTQPDDYQSLEILKEAYQKVGRGADSLKTSRRLAEAYFGAGSYTLAMQECEVILLKEPNAPEILAMLGDIETRLQAAGHAIATTGLVEQRVPRRILEVRSPFWVRDGDKLLVVVPAPHFKINYFVAFPEPVGNQFLETPAITPEYFLREISPNRTFGFRAEVEALYSQGLALGGSLENAVVIDRDGYMGELRFPDEIVRHKALDLIGDFALLGMHPRCEVIALKSGHALHVAAVRELLAPFRAAAIAQ